MARKAPGKSRVASKAPDASTLICVIHGPEEMLKREALHALRSALEAEHGEVETFTFDGEIAPLADVLDELRSYGLMQQYKIVVVDAADQFVSAHREALERYAQSPVEHSTLVLRSGRWHPGKIDRMIQEVGYLVSCKPVSPSVAASWLMARAKAEHGRQLDADTAALLVRRVGCDLMRLESELSKLALLVGENERIESETVALVAGRGGDEAAWVIQEAIISALSGPAGRSAARARPPAAGAADPGAAGVATAASEGGTLGGQAIEKIHELVELSGQPDVLVAYFVADLVRKFHLALMMKREGIPDGQIGRQLKLWGPKLSAFMGLVRRLDDRSADRLFDRIVELDRRAKSGFGKPMRNLECFCAVLADYFR